LITLFLAWIKVIAVCRSRSGIGGQLRDGVAKIMDPSGIEG